MAHGLTPNSELFIMSNQWDKYRNLECLEIVVAIWQSNFTSFKSKLLEGRIYLIYHHIPSAWNKALYLFVNK